MENRFENYYLRDKQWAKDAYRYLCFCTPARIACFVLFGICMLSGLYSRTWFYILFPPFWFAIVVFQYVQSYRITVKRDVERFGEEAGVRMAATDECITQTDVSGGEVRLNYADIRKAIRTKKYIYLMTNAKLVYSFKRDGFSLGTDAEFWDFLKSKGVKAK